MREVKFRAKTATTDEWVYGHYAFVDGYHVIYENGRPLIIKLNTLGQFTGLKDKNGREIYEGDILRLNFINESYISEVYWHGDDKEFPSPEFDINWKKVNTGFLESNFLCEVQGDERWCVEIIGNIYEHPHLLEGDSQ
ncbi:MAG TPA: YopX family protein [Ureibacillus sp.]|nr:YopX family protein [Ureibacillus sp.]